ncbi:nicotinate (nicotinamide) nucleotide adenylyltransferase [bacterium (Candidatus Blackallbacteria) CG17_big_fil_post_rev_8_21_14_2_50_48_46]|uniref:Probable nicotinate-nucleotide adenylyltransferase n=1 Tax=bacterium (Candidatus Blackallbacteria) CG17_big_fil_post_rev_8_21_14_2_50_48_46 TaxID=2014261 RepID=A0A2M7G668_9BACT|nr:MAG: nicotinate (nicotinamide) nucleotide adenylyltransferase [bacterium (Candidatus Blackallbacteria) CG18_big_fil_WC_8_21_14_2_50_49_26]PIW17492.1 MAG: nicotinate (nicotinamide) nucleotide adenylyltransferase [bacterium (Candidatus Blackallbacteria) CG17_big_fil_post_rev_8_21_14_2_50_48_46]PIW48346.1 MAG: nicotinate (nicotinamide) nucleotide adenylyltransferase [bacterium (Candidatus Blackallbacteria) CG13_big_fil_rev_8_21_14_2_50_49_14]
MPHPVGLLGGTFDPIHIGHLSMAQWSADALGLSEVWLIPAGQPPHKADRAVTAAQDRLKICELASADNPKLKVCALEIEKNSASYTIETLESLSPRFREKPWLIIGLDSLLNLPSWHRWKEFGKYCKLAVLPRQHGWIHDAASLQTWCEENLAEAAPEIRWLDLPQVDISSTLLRRVLKQGYDCRYALHPKVWDYIKKNRLYQIEHIPPETCH